MVGRTFKQESGRLSTQKVLSIRCRVQAASSTQIKCSLGLFYPDSQQPVPHTTLIVLFWALACGSLECALTVQVSAWVPRAASDSWGSSEDDVVP